jgi:uncharacterized protein YhdP
MRFHWEVAALPLLPQAHLEPTNFTFSMREPTTEHAAGGQFEFDRMQLQPLRELAAFLPLPVRWRNDLARFAPRGTLVNGHLQWQGTTEAPTAFAVGTEFADLGIVAQDAFPGASGFSGSVDATEKGGELKLATRNAALELPRVFAGPIPLDALQGALRWNRMGERTRIDIQRLEFTNAHAAGNLSGTYRTSAQGPGEVDLTAQLSRGDPREAYRYLPNVAYQATHEWLRRALTQGEVTDTRMKLSGDLAHFPFADGKGGQFIVTVKGRGVTLDFADHWPPIEGIDGELRFEGASMTIDAARGRVFGPDRRLAPLCGSSGGPPHLTSETRRVRCRISCATSRRALSTRSSDILRKAPRETAMAIWPSIWICHSASGKVTRSAATSRSPIRSSRSRACRVCPSSMENSGLPMVT